MNSDKSAGYKVNTSGNMYILTFDNITELQSIFTSDFIPAKTSVIKADSFDVSTLSGTKKYAIKVKVTMKDSTLGILQFDITSWNLNKISTSEISRTIYLAG